MAPQEYRILILGGGVAGLTTALALSKFAPPNLVPKIDIYEIRPEPGTVGGAINLTPNALRLLDFLGVYQVIKDRGFGAEVNAVEVFSVYHPHKLAESSFRGPHDRGLGDPPYKALRITRASLMTALLTTLPSHPNITLHLAHRTTSITSSSPTSITVTFSPPRPPSTGHLLLGCDGVHSFTRNSFVDPSRKQVYTGVVNAFGFTPDLSEAERAEVHFETSALNFSRRGLLLTSWFDEDRRKGYVGAIIARGDEGSREGWRAVGEDGEGVRGEMRRRFVQGDGDGTGKGEGKAVLPSVKTFVERARSWWLWPVYMVDRGGEGRWWRDRAMLLGDAAHGMPPQGESTGIVLEGTVLFARCWAAKMQGRDGEEGGDEGRLEEVFEAYERLRRARVQAACNESMAVINSVKETSRFGFWLKTCIIPVFLRLGRAKRQKHFEEDVTKSDLGFTQEMDAEDADRRVVVIGEKSLTASFLSRLINAWRQGSLWRLLRIFSLGRS